MRYLGLDVGNRRIGVATVDSEVRLATPVDVIVRTSLEQDTRALAAWVQRYGAEQIVIGLPRNMDGTHGPQAQAAQAYGEQVGHSLNLPVIFWDERLSSVEATRKSHESGARGKKSRRNLDAIAAAVILQDYIDHLADQMAL